MYSRQGKWIRYEMRRLHAAMWTTTEYLMSDGINGLLTSPSAPLLNLLTSIMNQNRVPGDRKVSD